MHIMFQTTISHVIKTAFVSLYIVVLGGLVDIVLVIGPKVRGLKPSRGRWISKGDKNS
jgi:hypothetical protein